MCANLVQVADLREELALLKGGEEVGEEVSEETRSHLEQEVNAFLASKDASAQLNIGPHMNKIRICFTLLKERCLGSGGGGGKGGEGQGREEQEEKIRKLTQQVKQRDNEIVILVNMINQAKKSGNQV